MGLVLTPYRDLAKKHRVMQTGHHGSFLKMWAPPKRARNQKLTSACVTFTIGHLIESQPFSRRGVITNDLLIERYLRAQDLDGIPGREPEYYGTTLEGGFKSFQEIGLLTGEPIVSDKLSAILTWIKTRGPVLMGTIWTTGMNNPRKNGVVTATGQLLGHHAWLLIGADMRGGNNGDLFGLNSYGPNFGVGGRFQMSVSTMRTLLSDGGHGMSALQDESQIR